MFLYYEIRSSDNDDDDDNNNNKAGGERTTDGRKLEWTENWNSEEKEEEGWERDTANDDIIDPVTTAIASLLHIK